MQYSQIMEKYHERNYFDKEVRTPCVSIFWEVFDLFYSAQEPGDIDQYQIVARKYGFGSEEVQMLFFIGKEYMDYLDTYPSPAHPYIPTSRQKLLSEGRAKLKESMRVEKERALKQRNEDMQMMRATLSSKKIAAHYKISRSRVNQILKKLHGKRSRNVRDGVLRPSAINTRR
jgi:DNA-binding CsgD family transcriptional regulator